VCALEKNTAATIHNDDDDDDDDENTCNCNIEK
jgi:hypothetical protein